MKIKLVASEVRYRWSIPGSCGCPVFIQKVFSLIWFLKNLLTLVFPLVICCMKTHSKGVSVAAVRAGMLIIVFNCVLFIGNFLFFCQQFAVGSFCLEFLSPDLLSFCLTFFFPSKSFRCFLGNQIDCYTAVQEDFALHLFAIAPGASLLN